MQNNWLPKCHESHVNHPQIDRIAYTDFWRAECSDCDVSVTAMSQKRALEMFQTLIKKYGAAK